MGIGRWIVNRWICFRQGHSWKYDSTTLGGDWIRCSRCHAIDEWLPGVHEPEGYTPPDSTDIGKYNALPRIVAAAIRRGGCVFTGTRHGFIIRQMVDTGFLTDRRERIRESEQGFLNSNNQFVSREKAKVQAIRAGQLDKKHKGTLYSEDLW